MNNYLDRNMYDSSVTLYGLPRPNEVNIDITFLFSNYCGWALPQTWGSWFNINMSSYQFRKSHCRDKTISQSPYRRNGISNTGKMASLYWMGALVFQTNCSDSAHWRRVMHICVSRLDIIGSDKGLSPGRHQAIIWTNAGIFLIWALGTNFSQIRYFHYRKCIWKSCWKMAAILSRPQCVNKNSRLQVHMPNTATTVTCPLISWGLWFVASDTIWGPFYWHGLTLIQAWISNYMPGKVWDEITYPFLNFNGATVEV